MTGAPPRPADRSGGPPAPRVGCLTWNVHRARGGDGRVDPGRVAAALAHEACAAAPPDVLALQEADTEARPHRGLLDLGRLERETGLAHAQAAPGLRWGDESHGLHGVVVLLAARVAVAHADLLDLPGHCPRGAVVLEARVAGTPVRIVATHLSLGQPLRMAQLRVVGQYLDRRPPMPTILMGDLNEWRPWGGAALSPRLLGRHFAGPAPATFPVRRPLLPLDRILVTPPARIRTARVLDGPLTRAASDHRPLAAEVELPSAGP